MSFFTELPGSFVMIGAGAAAISALAGAAFSAIAKTRVRLVTAINEKEKARDYHAEVRLREIKAMIAQESDKKHLFRIASASLVIGQFIVGGLLTSSFVTKNLNEGVVGFLGLVVLGSSLISQHFRPNFLHRIAAERNRRLRSLRRWLEDEVYMATRSIPLDEERLIKARLEATRVLEKIDESEAGWLLEEGKTKI